MRSTAITDVAVVTEPAALLRVTAAFRRAGESVGLVPTMGALHRGHRSLIDAARRDNDRVVVSIFVNPAQFAPHEDLDRYPRTPEADMAMLRDAAVDVVYLPGVEAMYPPGATTTVSVGAALTTILEGAARPGHFDGVALVVTKLLAACRPDRAYFGQKDAQQCAVVRRLVADLDLGPEIVICPVVRDPDGLALSSRNVYLSPAGRAAALAIPRGLSAAARLFEAGARDVTRLLDAVRAELDAEPGLRTDYVAAVDPDTLAAAETAAVKTQILVAAKISGTRLIDVLRLGVDVAPEGNRVSSSREGEASGVAGV